MKTNRLSKTLQTALNHQLTKEAAAAQVYLAFGAWASQGGYAGIARYLFQHAGEERNHMMKILEYILERGASVSIASIPAPSGNPENLQNCFEQVFEQETENTRGIYKIVKMSFAEEDWATWHFIQWFVNEQTEEETMALQLLDKLKVAGGIKASSEALYALDKDLHSLSGDITLAESKTVLQP